MRCDHHQYRRVAKLSQIYDYLLKRNESKYLSVKKVRSNLSYMENEADNMSPKKYTNAPFERKATF